MSRSLALDPRSCRSLGVVAEPSARRRGSASAAAPGSGCGVVGAAFVLAVRAVLRLAAPARGRARRSTTSLYTWMRVGDFSASTSRSCVDPLSALMLLVVTGVGFLIHVYSIGYMAHDAGYRALLRLPEPVHVRDAACWCSATTSCSCSSAGKASASARYLLIGFWFDEAGDADAGKKAFIVNRIGDFGFLLGMFAAVRRLRHARVRRAVRAVRRPHVAALGPRHRSPSIGAAAVRRRHRQVRADPALRLAAGRDGRPDAGLGADPRRDDGHGRRLPDGALARRSSSSRRRPRWRSAVVGASTALLRGDDRPGAERHQEGARLLDGLASSASCSWPRGVGAFAAGVFHLVTHAFFKALLFLGAGLGDPRDGATSRTCGRWAGSRREMPRTHRDVAGRRRSRSPASRRSPASSPRTRSCTARSPSRGTTAALGWWASIARGADRVLHVRGSTS